MSNELTPVQKKLLIMLKWLVGFLEENRLKYFIIGGTLLGACRHQGFIPWDDDIDIGMPRTDYEKLLKIFVKRNSHYILENYLSGSSKYFLCFSKVYDMNTSMIMKSKNSIKRGVFIDIFPIDGIGDYGTKEKKLFKRIYKMKRIISRRSTAFDKKYGFKNVVYFFYRLLPVNEKKMISKINKLCQKYSYAESNYVGNLVGSYHEKEILTKDIFGDGAIYKFENLFVNGPMKFDEYLTHLYGEWKKMPPVEKRVRHQNECIDLSSPFSDKECPIDIFSDR